jgi:hypothetical protein
MSARLSWDMAELCRNSQGFRPAACSRAVLNPAEHVPRVELEPLARKLGLVEHIESVVMHWRRLPTLSGVGNWAVVNRTILKARVTAPFCLSPVCL